MNRRSQVEAEIAGYRDRLDEMIDRRTAELRQSNLKLQQELAKHHKTAVALQQSEENFRALADNARDGFIIIAGDERFVYANRRAAEITGYSLAELSTLSIKDLVHPDKYRLLSARYRRRLAGEEVVDEYETTVVCKNGRLLPVEITAAMTIWSGQPANVVSFRDVSERKQAERELRQSEERFRRVITSISDHIYVTEVAPTGEHSNLYLSPNVEDLTGYPPERFLTDWSRWANELIHPADRAAAAAQLARLDKGRPSEAEYRLIRRDGDVIWVRDSARVENQGSVKRIYGVVHDITARKEAEGVVVRYSERLEILRQIEQGILSAQSVEEIGQAAMGRIRRLIPCHTATITILDQASNEAVVVTGNTAADDDSPVNIQLALKDTNQLKDRLSLLRQKQIVILDQADLAPEYQNGCDRSIRSAMIAPLVYQDELIGSLNLSATGPETFTPEHREIAHQVADQLAIAIRQADLYQQVQRHAAELEQRVADRTRELSALYEVTAVASEVLELELMLDRCLEQVLVALESNTGLILLRDDPEQEFTPATQRGIPPHQLSRVEALLRERNIVARVVDRGGPVIIPDIGDFPGSPPEIAPDDLGCYAGAPVRAAGQLIGILNIFGGCTRQFNIEELALLASVADQIGVAVENVRLRQQAEQAAVRAERERMARELHDSVTQSLYSLTLFCEGSLELARSGETELVEHNLTRIGETAQQALQEMRMMVYELRPPDLEREGLVGALHRRLSAVEKRAGINARLVAEELVELPPETEQELYWIVQEALNNVIKHADASAVSVHIRRVDENTVIEIVDDGQGFDPRAVEDRGGLGLTNIRERVRKLGGRVEISSTPNRGTSIRVETKA